MTRTNQHYGWRPDLPDHRDLALSLPKKAMPKSVSLETGFGDWGVYDQGQLGSCTANAIAGAVVFAEQKEGAADTTPTKPSRLFIYYAEREIEGSISSDSGAEIRDGMKVVATQGYPDEKLWPYVISSFAKKPTPSVYVEAKKDHVLRYYRVAQTLYSMRLCLAHGFPFVFGITVYDSFESANVDTTGDVPMPAASEGVLGGHAVLCTGYDDTTKRFKFRNSWSPTWGRNGSGTIPYAYLVDPNLAGDIWTIRRETE